MLDEARPPGSTKATERADTPSNTFWDERLDRAFIALAAKVLVKRFLGTSQEPSAGRMPSSERLDAAQAMCAEVTGGAVWRIRDAAVPQIAGRPPVRASHAPS
jgi:hypothetical protein